MLIEANIFDILNFKTELLIEETIDLIEYYNTEKEYKKLLSSSLALLRNDPMFLLLNDNLKKVIIIISDLRNNYKENHDLANHLISEFNKLSLLKNKEILIDKYYKDERKLRGKIFNKKSEILNSILHDSVFISSVNEDYSEVDAIYFLATSIYFVNKYPMIYKNEQVKNATDAILKAIKTTDSIRVSFLLRKIKKNINNSIKEN